MLLLIIIFISNNDLTLSENQTALNTTAIDNILTSKIPVNTSQLNESAVTDYLYGDSGIIDQQLDLSVFEPEEAKVLLETVQFKEEQMEREFNKSRRYTSTPGYIDNDYFIKKIMEFMQQSIYGTRFRLQETRYIRKVYSGDIAYNMAIFYGSLMQMRIKMDNIYQTMHKLGHQVKFIWFLVLYERCIATTVDANFMVERIFAMRQGKPGRDDDHNNVPVKEAFSSRTKPQSLISSSPPPPN